LNSAARVFVVAIALAALTSALAALAVLWTPRASLGFGVSGRTITGVAPHSSAGRAGIRAGDRVDASTPFGVRLRSLWYDDYRPGEIERLTIDRGSKTRTVALVAEQHPPPFNSTAKILIAIALLTYGVFVVVGTTLLLARPARFTWGFFLCCLGLAANPGMIGWSLSTIDPSFGFAVYCLWFVAADVAPIGFLIFALRFPDDALFGWRRGVMALLPLWFVGLVILDAWSTAAWYSGSNLPDWTQWASQIAGLAAWVAGTLSLALTYRSAEPRNRKRLLWAIIGSSIGFLGWYADGFLTSLGMVLAGRIAGFAMLAIPLSVGYAVLKHRVIDVRFALNRALAFSVLATMLVGILALSYWVTAAVLQQSHALLLVQIAIALLTGVSLHRIHGWIERAIKGALFRSQRAAEERLSRVATALEDATSFESAEMMLVGEPLDTLNLEYAIVYRRGHDGAYCKTAAAGSSAGAPLRLADDEPLVLVLKSDGAPFAPRRPIGDITPAVAIPVADGGDLFAIATFGPHRSGFDIDPDEIRMLRNLCGAAARAYRGLAARTAEVRRLAELLRSSPALGNSEVEAYLAEQVLHSLSAEDRHILAACANVPQATADDVVAIVENEFARNRLAELAKTTPFLTQEGIDGYRVHPMLAQTLRSGLTEEGRRDLLRCAMRARERGMHLRAAELFLVVGDRANVFASLEVHFATPGQGAESISEDLQMIVADAPSTEIVDFPRSFAAKLEFRWLLHDDAALRNETIAVVGRFHEPGPSAAWIAYSWSESGDQARAQQMLDRYPNDAGFTSSVWAMIAGKRGRLTECDARASGAAGALEGGKAASALPHIIRAAIVERGCGNWKNARTMLARAVDIASHCGSEWGTLALAESIISEWLAGDDAACAAAAQRFRAVTTSQRARSLSHLAANALGGAEDPGASCYPKFAAFSWLMRACSAASTLEAVRCAERAAERGAAAGEPFIEALAFACLADLEPRARFDHLERACALARQIESVPLGDAMGSSVAGEGAGMLDPLLAKIRRLCSEESMPMVIELASGKVRRGHKAIALSERELALVFALARSARPSTSAELIDTLWPELDEASGSKALQTCVYRLRIRVSDPRAVESVAQGYRLGEDATVDLWEAERFLAISGAMPQLDYFATMRLEGVARRFGAPRPGATAGWEWFAAVERRIADVIRAARRRLAQHYLDAGDYHRSLEFANAMIATDEFDEPARELAIRAHLGAGDIAEGRREYRLYRELLARELEVEPAPSLANLLNGEGNGRTH
jgi:DNA-binding SARP family transcriptional activator